MLTLDYTNVRVNGAIQLHQLRELELYVTVNAHGWACVTGEADENALKQLTGPISGRELNILATDETGAERSIFSGVIHEAELVSMGNWNGFRLELVSGTSLLDQKKRSRSFQAVGNTYSQIAQQVVSAYSGGAAICSVGEDTALERPLIQYRETDWEFLRRIASHLGGVVVPEVSRGLPRIWFGFPDRSYECEFSEDNYQSGISERYYALGGAAAGYDRADFLYYDVESSQLYDLGWYTKFKGQSFIISEKYGKLEHGELRFKYRLGRPGLGWAARQEHEKISGMSLQGEVVGTTGETVKLKLDIDQGWNPGGAYAYPWRPATGNLMYCMPQVGTRVALYFPNMDEKQAQATSCVRTNGGNCERMGDPSRRSFVTEHGKELNLYPGELSLKSGEESTVTLSDETGINFTTAKSITMVAEGPIQMEAPEVSYMAPVGELQLAKADVESGAVLSSYTQSEQFDAIANGLTAVEGTVTTSYPAIPDSLEVVEDPPFDWGKLFLNVAIGIVAVAAVAIALTGVGAVLVGAGAMAAGTVSAMVTGAVVGGCVSVAACAVGDVIRGEVSDVTEYLFAGISGAITGAIFSGVSSSKFFLNTLPKMFQSKFIVQAARTGVMASTGFLTGAGNNLAGQLCNGTSWNELDWNQVLGMGAISGATSGLFYAGSQALMQLKVVQNLIYKLNNTSFGKTVQALQTRLTNFIQNNGSKVSAALHGGQSRIPTVGELRAMALQWRDENISSIPSKIRGRVSKVSILYNPKTGTLYGGFNRQFNNIQNGDSAAIEAVRVLWPANQLNDFTLGACAENMAFYQAIRAGENLDDLILCTVNLNKNLYGTIFSACENCTYAFRGIPKDGLSGWTTDWQARILSAIMGVLDEVEEKANETELQP